MFRMMAVNFHVLSLKSFIFSVAIFLTTQLVYGNHLRMLYLVQPSPIVLNYHGGQLLKPQVTVNILWYGKFSAPQRAIVVDFIRSLNRQNGSYPLPSVASWWATIGDYKGGPCTVVLGNQILDENYSIGKRGLANVHLKALAAKAGNKSSDVNLVITAADVAVNGFCMSRCGSHGWFRTRGSRTNKFAYAWVGNSVSQCPGECAWPFHKPLFGPQTPALIAPNGDVGMDGMIINIATVLAGAVTNPFGQGYFQGPTAAGLEAVTACAGLYGTGAFPGYAGKLLVDKTTKASFNAYGINGRKYMLPALWDPKTSICKPLV